MNQKSVRLTSTLTALSALAAAVVAIVAVNSSGLLSAQSATTTIDLLNVGMCVTTDDSVFKEADCDDGDDNETTFTVGDRDEIVERDAVYATYAFDPISSSDRPRAIIENSDLVKVTISDKGRDRRRSVLYPASVGGNDNAYDNLLDGEDNVIVAKIKNLIAASDFAEMLSDEDSISGFESKEITLYQPRMDLGEAVINDSGSAGLNFKRERTSTADFLPLSDDEQNDVVLLFGFEVDDGQSTTVDDVTKVTAQVDDLKILGAGSSRALLADEDRSSGGGESGDTPPWLTVLANVPNGKDLVIVTVLYETSDEEIILGGARCDQVDGDEKDRDCLANQGNDRPVFTRSETDNAQPLVANVQGDNGQTSQNLYLKEDGKFTGKYTGFIRITDANGDGESDAPDWGLEFAAGTNETASGAAVVGVQSGPATITYKDSNGATRTMRIEIDIQPPTITIASPLHNSSGDDRSPDFVGTFEDGGVGLADDTFKLYVDNKTDGGAGAVGDSLKDSDPVLNIPTTNIGISGSKTRVEISRDYGSTDSFNTLFGVLSGVAGAGTGRIYFTTTGATPEASETDNDAKRKIVNADIYDDGDGQGTFDDDARYEGNDSNGREIAVDFQGVVLDLAGNIGFSDADVASPSRINDLGTAIADRLGQPGNPPLPNVLGFYSRHVINLDDKDPEFKQENTITGYYGLDSDGNPVPHRRGIMITFDNDVSQDNITENTFDVELDDGTKAVVEDFRVEGKLVFLRLAADLGSSETPKISIASGRRVEDFAGNQLHAREQAAFEAKDGVPPTLTVSLSNGSGTGEGNESSTSLTRNTIVVSVTSDERLQGAPFVSVVCSNFSYTEGTSTARKDVDDFAASRSGPKTEQPSVASLGTPRCGTGTTAQTFTPAQEQMFTRGELNWEYTWRNLGGTNALPEGELRVVVFARDRSQYQINPDQSGTTYNFNSTTAKFTYDTSLKPLVRGTTIDTTAGEIQPRPGQDVSENRPTIMLYFSGENTQIEVEKLLLDDIDVTARIDSNERNRFIYSPDALNLGAHNVEVDVRDAAGNTATFRYDFNVVTRSPFVVRLATGWNAISVPQQPIDGSLEAVFSNPEIDQVISYVRASKDAPPEWLLATRQDGIWTTNYGELTDIRAGLGYWVHTNNWVTQSIPLRNPGRQLADLPSAPIGITTYSGWNFVGVVDQDGDQTQNDWGQTVKQGNVAQTGRLYLGNYVRAYTWDATLRQFESIEPSDSLLIGDGIWVYFGEGIAP